MVGTALNAEVSYEFLAFIISSSDVEEVEVVNVTLLTDVKDIDDGLVVVEFDGREEEEHKLPVDRVNNSLY